MKVSFRVIYVVKFRMSPSSCSREYGSVQFKTFLVFFLLSLNFTPELKIVYICDNDTTVLESKLVDLAYQLFIFRDFGIMWYIIPEVLT